MKKDNVIGKVGKDGKVSIIDSKQASEDVKILESAKEILEDKSRMEAVRMVSPDINVRLDGKGPAFQGSTSVNVSELRESKDNVHNVFKDVTKRDDN